MAKPGPRPRATAPKSTHIAFTDKERATLNKMGSGDVKSKIRALILLEAERQKPKSKEEAMDRYLGKRKNALRLNREVFGEETQLKEMGWTEEEIQLRKEEQNATN